MLGLRELSFVLLLSLPCVAGELKLYPPVVPLTGPRASQQLLLLEEDNGRTVAKILPETEVGAVPYFAQRKASTAFLRLDQSGKSGQGWDVTEMIAQDREDRI